MSDYQSLIERVEGRPVQEHPAYHEGFHDAAQFEPLFSDASPEYRSGWSAYWSCRSILRALQSQEPSP